MIFLLYGIIFIALLIIIYQFSIIRSSKSQLNYLFTKLNQIITASTDEKVKIFTSDKSLMELLEVINQLLEINRNEHVEKIRYQSAMRKMLANISHDLKTPLTVVNGYIETLLVSKNLDTTRQTELLTKVHSKSNELVGLINNFFDLAKLESNDMDIPLSKINVSEIIRRTMLTYFELLTSNQVEAILDIPDEDYYIIGNEEALTRILDNLISNALRYGSEGKTLGISIETNKKKINITIWDKGKGIDEKYQTDVFERLYTLEDSRNKDYQGSGLGLTITKRLTEKMNGTISLTSIPFTKTSFTLIFDLLDY